MPIITTVQLHASAVLRALAILLLSSASLTHAASPMDMADVSVTSSLRHEFSVDAGDTQSGVLTIANRGAAAASVTITQADLAFDEAGGVEYEDAGSVARSNASWIHVSTRVDVPAGGQVQVPFTVEVPADDALHGSYWSVLRVQPEAATRVTTESQAERVTTSVEVIVQYGVIVLTHVGTPDSRTLLFEPPAFRHDPDSGEHRLHVVLHNPGTHVVSTKLWLELYDEDGGLVTRFDTHDQRIYPGVSVSARLDLGTLEPQVYQAVVVADAGGSDVFGVRYNLDTTP